MKRYISDIEKANTENPCNGCQVGWGSYSRGKDEKGEYVETHDCHETCEKLKKDGTANDK